MPTRNFKLATTGFVMIAALLMTTAGPVSAAPLPIKHIIIIMQENRSFDEYFGVYPGVNGIPPGVRLTISPGSTQTVSPYLETSTNPKGGPHSWEAAQESYDNGKMRSPTIMARWMDLCGLADRMRWVTMTATCYHTTGLTPQTTFCSTTSSSQC